MESEAMFRVRADKDQMCACRRTDDLVELFPIVEDQRVYLRVRCFFGDALSLDGK